MTDMEAARDEACDVWRKPLFDGDTGTLDKTQRKVLTALVKNPFIDSTMPTAGAGSRSLFAVLVDDESLIRSRLADLMLALVIDEANEIAYALPAEAASPAGYVIKPRTQLTRNAQYELLQLRRRVIDMQTSLDGRQSAYLTFKDIETDLRRLPTYADEADAKRVRSACNAVIGDLRRYGFLRATKATDKFEITLLVASVITQDRVESMCAAFGEGQDE